MPNYKYRFSYKNQQFLGNSRESLEKALIKEYKISPQEAESIVNKLINNSIPTIRTQNFKSTTPKDKTFSEVIAGAKATLKSSIGMGVSQEEINNRAIKCTGCPKMAKATYCTSCGWSGKFANFLKSMFSMFKKTYIIPNNLSDKFCSVCSCSLAVMLPARLEDFNKESEAKIEERKKVNCWITPQ